MCFVPHGPEAMSLDMVFPGLEHVCGLLELAINLSLRATNASERAKCIGQRLSVFTAGTMGLGVVLTVNSYKWTALPYAACNHTTVDSIADDESLNACLQ